MKNTGSKNKPGRPAKYTTPEEKEQARKLTASKYYNNNRAKIEQAKVDWLNKNGFKD